MRLCDKLKENIELHDQRQREDKVFVAKGNLDVYVDKIVRLINHDRCINPLVHVEEKVFDILREGSPSFCEDAHVIWPSSSPMIEEIEQAWMNFVDFFNEEGLRVNVDEEHEHGVILTIEPI